MSLYRYFAKSSKLPDPNGELLASVSPAAIKDANEAVKSVTCERKSKRRGSYSKFSPEQQAAIGTYAFLNGNQAAVRHFSKQLGVELKVTSVQTWKTKYVAELHRKRKAGEMDDLTVKALPVKKLGRLLLGEKLDSQVKAYIQALCEEGGVVTTSITMAAATAIVRTVDRNLLEENGGPITITNNWAKSLLYRMNFVKRRGSSTAKLAVPNFEALKEQFVIDVNAVVEMEDIPPQLIFNCDQTGISVVPGSSWTMEAKELNVSRSLDWETSDKLRLCFVVQCLVNFSLHSLSTRERQPLACLATSSLRTGM